MNTKSQITHNLLRHIAEIPGANHGVPIHDLTTMYAEYKGWKVDINQKDAGIGRLFYNKYRSTVRSIMANVMDYQPCNYHKIKVNGVLKYYYEKNR